MFSTKKLVNKSNIFHKISARSTRHCVPTKEKAYFQNFRLAPLALMIQQQKEHDKAISNYQNVCLALLALIMLSTKYSVNKENIFRKKNRIAPLIIMIQQKKGKIMTYLKKNSARSTRTL